MKVLSVLFLISILLVALVESHLGCGTRMPAREKRDVEQGTSCFFDATCDDPTNRDKFAARDEIVVRILYHVTREGTGANPIVTPAEVSTDVTRINEYFKSAGIRFDHRINYVDNTEARYGLIHTGFSDCKLAQIGDGTCQKACNDIRTGYDGGDCQEALNPDNCPAGKSGNNVCDKACNFKKYNWDGGDCCNDRATGSTGQCRDPALKATKAVYRFTPDTYKTLINTPYASQALNVFMPEWCGVNLGGQATFPSDKAALTATGGYFSYAGSYKAGNPSFSLNAHELGHCLGLFHIFQDGFDTGCTNCDGIYNGADANRVADYCSDTPFYTSNTGTCLDTTQKDCRGNPYPQASIDAAAFNIMSYMECDEDFKTQGKPRGITTQQGNRCRCYLGNQVKGWVGTWAALTGESSSPSLSPGSSSSTSPSITPSTSVPTSSSATSSVSSSVTASHSQGSSASPTPSVSPSVSATKAGVPAGWTCDAAFYNAGPDDGCDCECGVQDPDCSFTGIFNAIFGCDQGTGATCVDGKCQYKNSVPAGWVCDNEFYNNNDGCDCECGIPDPDCTKGDAQASDVFNCATDSATCTAEGLCQNSVPSGWTCDAEFYANNDGCDCKCGVPDPDCEDPAQIAPEFVFGCFEGQTCDPRGKCIEARVCKTFDGANEDGVGSATAQGETRTVTVPKGSCTGECRLETIIPDLKPARKATLDPSCGTKLDSLVEVRVQQPAANGVGYDTLTAPRNPKIKISVSGDFPTKKCYNVCYLDTTNNTWKSTAGLCGGQETVTELNGTGLSVETCAVGQLAFVKVPCSNNTCASILAARDAACAGSDDRSVRKCSKLTAKYEKKCVE